MSTISIINNGPGKVRVVAVNEGGPNDATASVLAPSERVDFEVHGEQGVHVIETSDTQEPDSLGG